MSSSRKLTSKGTLRQVFICLRPSPEPHTFSPHKHCIRVYSILIHAGKRGRGESLTREKVRGATIHKAGLKIPKRLTVSPVKKFC